MNETTMTQKDRILERLKAGEWLSVIEATKEMCILRLGARIYDLRAEGHNMSSARLRERVIASTGS